MNAKYKHFLDWHLNNMALKKAKLKILNTLGGNANSAHYSLSYENALPANNINWASISIITRGVPTNNNIIGMSM